MSSRQRLVLKGVTAEAIHPGQRELLVLCQIGIRLSPDFRWSAILQAGFDNERLAAARSNLLPLYFAVSVRWKKTPGGKHNG